MDNSAPQIDHRIMYVVIAKITNIRRNESEHFKLFLWAFAIGAIERGLHSVQGFKSVLGITMSIRDGVPILMALQNDVKKNKEGRAITQYSGLYELFSISFPFPVIFKSCKLCVCSNCSWLFSVVTMFT